MATVVTHHSQCYSSSALFGHRLSSTSGKHALPKKRIMPRRGIVLHRGVRTQCRAGLGGILKKPKKGKSEEDDDVDVVDDEDDATIKPKTGYKLQGTTKLPRPNPKQPKDNGVVFVAGATGKVGSRTVRELLKLGFRVRAAARNVEKAEALFEEFLQNVPDESEPENGNPFAVFSPAKLFGFLKPKPGKALEIVDCDLEDPETIEPAIGNAGVVVCCIGASEKEVLDVTGPYRIDFKATQNLIDAASEANVNHFVLLTSLGTQKVGFPAAVLNLFWGVLIWKAKAEKALIKSQIPYTIVRPGGMERPTDAYKETHNLRLSEADTLFGGQVSNLQVAELIASIVENPDVSVNKIVEVVAETTAPLRPNRELLEEISASTATTPIAELPIRKEMAPAKVGRTKVVKEKVEKSPQAAQKQVDKEKANALRERYTKEIEAAREKEEAAKVAADAALAEKAELQRRAAEIREKAEEASLAARQAKALESAILAAARKGKALSEEEKRKITDSVKTQILPSRSTQATKERTKKAPAFSFFKGLVPSKADPESDEAEVDDQAAAKEKQLVEEVKQKEALLAKKKEEQEKAAEKKSRELEEQKANAAAEEKLKEEKKKAEKEEKKAIGAAEAKKKEEQEQEKAEIEAKELEEQKAKEAAVEAKKEEELEKAAEEAKLKEEAEKAAALAAVKTAVAETKEEKFEPPKKGFRWFWEPEEKTGDIQEATVVSANVEATETITQSSPQSPYMGFPGLKPPTPPVPSKTLGNVQEQAVSAAKVPVAAREESDKKLPYSSRALSPYTMYPGLKPPSPPSPSQKKETQAAKASINTTEVSIPQSIETNEKSSAESAEEEPKEDIEAKKLLVQQIAQREKEALEKAKAATSFSWPWQKQEEKPEASSETNSILEKKEESSDTISTESPATTPRPLSPYTQYPGLKPPSPPKPYSGPKADAPKMVQSIPKSTTPLSPYTGFPDLKPPSPPSPLQITTENENGAAPEEENVLEPAVSSAFKWPWQ